MTVMKRRSFPRAFKRDAVERVISSGLPMGTIAVELGVHETVLRRWVALYSGSPAPGAEPLVPGNLAELMTENTRLRGENEQVLAENERLRAEKETLKRALAIIFAELN
jgi:transposase